MLKELINRQTEDFDTFYKDIEEELTTFRLVCSKSPYEMRNDKVNILLVQLNAIGDFVLCSGFIREVRNCYPNSHITLVVRKEIYDLARLCPYVNKIIFVTLNDTNVIACMNDCKELYERQYELGFSPHFGDNLLTSLLILWLAGCTYRIGYGEYDWVKYYDDDVVLAGMEKAFNFDNYMLNVHTSLPDPGHDVDKRYHILEELGFTLSNKKLEVWLDNTSITVPNNSIVVCLSASLNIKRFPSKKYLEVCKKLGKEYTYILLAGPKEENEIKYLSLLMKENRLEYMAFNDLSLNQVGQLLKQCICYIGNDTGIAHIAAALDKPVITIIAEAKDKYSDTIEYRGHLSALERFHPYCSLYRVVQPEHAIGNCKSLRIHGGCGAGSKDGTSSLGYPHCITSVKVDDVVKAFHELIARE